MLYFLWENEVFWRKNEKKLRKNLVESNKVRTFAPAYET